MGSQSQCFLSSKIHRGFPSTKWRPGVFADEQAASLSSGSRFCHDSQKDLCGGEAQSWFSFCCERGKRNSPEPEPEGVAKAESVVEGYSSLLTAWIFGFSEKLCSSFVGGCPKNSRLSATIPRVEQNSRGMLLRMVF